jgi:hypothetical protein
MVCVQLAVGDLFFRRYRYAPTFRIIAVKQVAVEVVCDAPEVFFAIEFVFAYALVFF